MYLKEGSLLVTIQSLVTYTQHAHNSKPPNTREVLLRFILCTLYISFTKLLPYCNSSGWWQSVVAAITNKLNESSLVWMHA